MEYIPEIKEGSIARLYIGNLFLFNVKLGKISLDMTTADIRKEVKPGVFEVTVPAGFVPKCKITMEGTLQSDTELTFGAIDEKE